MEVDLSNLKKLHKINTSFYRPATWTTTNPVLSCTLTSSMCSSTSLMSVFLQFLFLFLLSFLRFLFAIRDMVYHVVCLFYQKIIVYFFLFLVCVRKLIFVGKIINKKSKSKWQFYSLIHDKFSAKLYYDLYIYFY